jgi:hypothetical protein
VRQPQRPGAPLGHEFTITFWCGPPLDRLDDARAAEIAAAGFTAIGAPCEGPVTPALNQQALAVAARHGLRLWITDPRLDANAVREPDWTARLAEGVRAYRDHPALAGYFVADEPPVSRFAAVAAVVAALRAHDPAHPAYVNLYADYAPPETLGTERYEDYLARYVGTVRPAFLSYDHYPFRLDRDRSSFFTNLRTIRTVATHEGLPFVLIVQAMPHGSYRDPTDAELAWQAFHALAAGAAGVSYFAYWTPVDVPDRDDWQFRYGLIEGGRPTRHYFAAARINHSLARLAAALETFSTVALADATGEVAPSPPLGPLDAVEGGPVTIGLFADHAGRFAALLVNRDSRYGVTVRVRTRPGFPAPRAFDAEQGRWETTPIDRLVLAPGWAHLLRW